MAGQVTQYGTMAKHRSTPSSEKVLFTEPRDQEAAHPHSNSTHLSPEALAPQTSAHEPLDAHVIPDISTSSRPASSGRFSESPEAPNHHNGVQFGPNTSTPTNSQHGEQITAIPRPARMLVPPCLRLDQNTQSLLRDTTLSPPVTKDTLSELDLTWIMNNISLRTDVNYDHDLHFTPISGKRGEEKRKNAHRYWLALAAELRIYLHNVQDCQQCHFVGFNHERFEFPQRLPAMFENLKVLLETLVPDRDHDQVAQNVDVDFLMQQVKHGVFDAARMSSWLAKLLKTHCAPMRDEWADAMSLKIEEGATDASMFTLVSGLEKLHGFLEAMKLDVANHQIRTLRYWLIEETIPFQKQYFKKRINSGKLSVHSSRDWYENVVCEYQKHCTARHSSVSVESSAFDSLLYGLTRLCKSNEKIDEIPLTFHHDRNRIRQLQEDIQDSIYLGICLNSFDQLTKQLVGRSYVAAHGQLRNRLLALTDNESNESCKTVAQLWHDHIDAVATEVTRFAYSICKGRSYTIPHEDFINTARYIRREFQEDNFCLFEEELLDKLDQQTHEQAKKFQHLSALELSEAQREWQLQQHPANNYPRHIPGVEDMARRLAHIGILHWQIWSGLAYLEFDMDTDEEDEDGDMDGNLDDTFMTDAFEEPGSPGCGPRASNNMY